jgi:hypothetical protein
MLPNFSGSHQPLAFANFYFQYCHIDATLMRIISVAPSQNKTIRLGPVPSTTTKLLNCWLWMPISIEHGRFNKFAQGLIFSERVEWGGSYEFLGLRPVSETEVSEKDENVLNKTLQKHSNPPKKQSHPLNALAKYNGC